MADRRDADANGLSGEDVTRHEAGSENRRAADMTQEEGRRNRSLSVLAVVVAGFLAELNQPGAYVLGSVLIGAIMAAVLYGYAAPPIERGREVVGFCAAWAFALFFVVAPFIDRVWNISGFVGFKPYVVHLGAGSFIQRSPPEQFTDGWKTAVVWASCFVAALAGWYVISTRRKPVGRGSPSDGSGDTPVGAAAAGAPSKDVVTERNETIGDSSGEPIESRPGRPMKPSSSKAARQPVDLESVTGEDRVMAAQKSAPTPSGTVDQGQKTGWDIVLPVLSAAATGIGVLGFVAFFGAAVLWVRADRARLPASEAVALMPRSILITTGAHFLVGALLLAITAVAALRIIDWLLQSRDAHRRARVERELGDKLTQAEAQLLEAEAQLERSKTALLMADNDVAKSLAKLDQGADDDAQRSVESSEQRRTEATNKRKEAAASRTSAEVALRQLEATADERRRRLNAAQLATRAAALGIPLLVLELLMTRFVSLAVLDYLALIGISLGTTAASIAVFLRTGKFLWFGIAVFFAVGIYQAFSTYFRTRDTPLVEPVAVLLPARPPVTGYFLAQTPDRIYVGTPGVAGRAALIALRRDDVRSIAIGRLVKVADATSVARRLARSLCKELPAPADKAATAAPRCQTHRAARSGKAKTRAKRRRRK